MTDDQRLKWEGDREEGMKLEEELKITRRQVSFMREEEEGNDEKNDEKRRWKLLSIIFMKQQLRSDEVSVMSAFAFTSVLLVSETKTHLNEQRCTHCLFCLIIPFSLSCCPYFCLSSPWLLCHDMREGGKERMEEKRGWKEEIDRQRVRQATSSWNRVKRRDKKTRETRDINVLVIPTPVSLSLASFLSFRHTIRIIEAVLA